MKWPVASDLLRRLTGDSGAAFQDAERVDIVSAIGPLADVLVFVVAMGMGVPLGPAQIAGFIVAAVLHYFLKVRAALAAKGRAGDLRLHGRLLVVSLMALFLRGGVLSLLTQTWGWPAYVAILFAIAAGLAVIRPGYALSIASTTWRFGSSTHWRALAVGLVVYAFVLRLVYLGQVELLPEETYYWNYSRHLDIGYLDHPPMVAWLITLGTAIFGNVEFGVRIGALCCGLIATFFTYRLTRNLFDEASALAVLVLAQVLPFFFLTGLVTTPDAPLTAAWAASLYFLERALIARRAGAWWWIGVCMGLGMLSKYSIGLLAPATFLFMLLDPQSRRWLWRWEPYAAAVVAVAIFSPVIVWNAQHEWASFAFQTLGRLAETPQFALHKLIASALVLITPTGLLAIAVALSRPRPDGPGSVGAADFQRHWRFVQVFVLVPLSVFVAFSLRHEVKLDWTGAPWVAALPALAFGMASLGEGPVRGTLAWIHGAWVPTVLVVVLFFGAGLQYLALGLPGVGYSKKMELVPIGWRDLGRQVHGVVEEVRTRTGEAPLIVGLDRYFIASELAFYAPDQVQSVKGTSSGHLFGAMGLMYERWFPPQSQQGRTLLLVAWDAKDLAGPSIESRVQRLDPIRDGVVTRDGGVIRPFHYRVAYEYRDIPQGE